MKTVYLLIECFHLYLCYYCYICVCLVVEWARASTRQNLYYSFNDGPIDSSEASTKQQLDNSLHDGLSGGPVRIISLRYHSQTNFKPY